MTPPLADVLRLIDATAGHDITAAEKGYDVNLS
jgi:hypothetical protein